MFLPERENILYSAYVIITKSYVYLQEGKYLMSRIYILYQTVSIIPLILFVYRIKESEEIIPLTLDIYNVRFWGTIYIIVSMYILSTTNKYYY